MVTLHCVRDTNGAMPHAWRSVDIARCGGSFSASKSIREPAMPVAIRQLHKHFFGEVSGVDLRKPLTPQEAADIEAGMDKYAVLLFRNQDITDEQQMAFALNFGERENPRGGNIVKPQDSRLSTGLNDVSNLGKDGRPLLPHI